METNFLSKIYFKLSIIFCFIFGNLNAATINGNELRILIENWLESKGQEANISILEELKYPRCDQSEMIINDISGNSKLIKVNCVGKNPWQFIVRNKINKNKKLIKKNKNEIKVFALKKSKNKGTILYDEDLITVNKKNGFKNVFIIDKSDIVGKRLKRNISANKALRYSNLQDDWLIAKNSLVTIVNNKSSITIKEEGLALNDANYMDKVKVKNVKSGKIIVGYAKNEKKVILNTKQK